MIKVLIDKFLNKRKPEAPKNSDEPTIEPVRDFIKQICKKIDGDEYKRNYEADSFRLKVKDKPLIEAGASYSDLILGCAWSFLRINENFVSLSEAEKEFLFVSLHCAHLREENARRLAQNQRIEEALASIKEW